MVNSLDSFREYGAPVRPYFDQSRVRPYFDQSRVRPYFDQSPVRPYGRMYDNLNFGDVSIDYIASLLLFAFLRK